ncbi:hypothetical protein [Aeromonas taiwanensis]
MFWPDRGSGVSVEPARTPVASAVRQYFTEGGAGQPPTVPGGDWFNQITNEILNVLAAAGIAPSKVDDDQLLQAIRALQPAHLPDFRTDPAGRYFGPSGVVIDTTAGLISGEPFVVRDDANSQWVMYFFRTVSGAPNVRCYYRTLPYASGMAGTWGSPVEITSLAGYHKFVLMVDVDGNPVQVDGNYHGYAVSFTGAPSSKLVYHFTSATLAGPWALGTNVLPKGAAGSKDEYFTDTPYAIYKDGTVYLWYMGAPASSLPTYGLAIRMLRATATDPNGPFTKSPTDVLLPDTVNGKWDYGWLGGAQIRRRPNGRFMMVYNGGDTRPSTVGDEPYTSRIGYAYSDSIDGPWIKDGGNPYFSPTAAPSDAVESTNIWRGHLAYDHLLGQWSMFYNTGTGTEKITRADQSVYDYRYGTGVANEVMKITTSLQTVTNSRINLPAGKYRVVAQCNLQADGGGTMPKLDVDTSLRVNGAVYRTNRVFVGSYAYENIDTVLNYFVNLSVAGYVDLSVQVTGGTPTTLSWLRNLRINAEQIN